MQTLYIYVTDDEAAFALVDAIAEQVAGMNGACHVSRTFHTGLGLVVVSVPNGSPELALDNLAQSIKDSIQSIEEDIAELPNAPSADGNPVQQDAAPVVADPTTIATPQGE